MSKSVRILCMMLAVITAMFGCSAATEGTTPTVDEKVMEKAVKASQEQIMESAVILSNLAQYENNYWKALESVGGNIDYDHILSEAYAWLQDKGGATQEEIVQAYANLSDQYAQISGDGDTVAQYKLLFQAYDRLYHLSTSPSGSRDQFVQDYNEVLDQLKSADSLLTALVG